jgi:uncharacterized protein YndB with AHSA1/START domain
MHVNEKAPVLASADIEIGAPHDVVWDALADINGWPQWNPAIAEAHLEGDLAPGSVFRWRAGPGGITSTLRQVDRPHTLAWTGKTFGINAIHIYRLEPTADGTHVHTAESWEGLPARLLRGRMQKMLEDGLGPSLEALKREAESRSHGRPGT